MTEKGEFLLVGKFKDKGEGKGVTVSLEVQGAELSPQQVMRCLETLMNGTMHQIQEEAKKIADKILVADKIPTLPNNGKRPPFGGRK